MQEPGERITVVVPEKEATTLCKTLRHKKELNGLGLSCYGFINKKDIRAIQIAVDGPDGVERYDLYYKADTVSRDYDKAADHAVKRILAKFDS